MITSAACLLNNKPNRKFHSLCVLLIGALLCVLSFASCDARRALTNAHATRNIVDEYGRRVRVPAHPERIISLAPSLTEIVYAIGAGNRLVGDTTYCDYPPEAQQVAKVGDTLQPNLERIIALRPQLVLVSTSSQLESFTQQLDNRGIAVYVSDARDLEGVLRSIENLGDVLDERPGAAQLVHDLRERTNAIEAALKKSEPVKVFFQLSREPLYTAGRDSFVTDLIERAGGRSVTANVPGAWPRYSDEAALAARPEAIIMATEDAMNKSATVTELAAALKQSPAAVNKRVYSINGNLLSRPGPRLVEGLELTARALHPEAFSP